MKKLLLTILGLVALISTTSAQSIVAYDSIYTPERPGVSFVEGIQGFDHPTFNNFINNPNISVGGRQGDEREFMTAKYCPDGNCCTEENNPNCYFYDTLALAPLEAGDKIRFEIYFHNNGNDSYDEFMDETSPDAQNVRIGIDLSDFSAQSTEPDLMIRPKGFIYSNNAEYQITDDIQAFLSANNLTLQPTNDMGIAMRKVNAEGQDWDITTDQEGDYWEWALFGWLTEAQSTTFQIPHTNNQVTATATPHVEGNKMWLHFDKLPGCFRYSGAAYFDAEVVRIIPEFRPPVIITPIRQCQELRVDHSEHIYAGTLSSFRALALDTSDNDLEDQTIYWVDEGYGHFYTEPPEGIPLNPSRTWIETILFEDSEDGKSAAFNFSMRVADGSFWDLGIAEPESLPEILLEGEIELRPLPPTPGPGPDPSPIDFGRLSVLDYGMTLDSRFDEEEIELILPNTQESTINLPQTIYGLEVNPDQLEPDAGNQETLVTPVGDIGRALLPEFENSKYIIVDPGTVVYFHALQPGTNVIHVRPANYTNTECTRNFSIEELPITPPEITCESAELIATSENGKETFTCLESRTYQLKTNFYQNQGTKIPDSKVRVKWTTTDPEGSFSRVPKGLWGKVFGGRTINSFTGENIVIYTGGGQVTAELYELDGNLYTQDNCNAQIDPCPTEIAQCAQLNLIVRPPAPLEIGQEAALVVEPKDTNNAYLPQTTTVRWSTDTGGKFTTVDGTDAIEITLNQLPILFKGSVNEGTITAQISPNDPAYSATCQESIAVQQQTTILACQSLSATITEHGVGQSNELQSNKLYKLTATATYSTATQNNRTTFNINSNYGIFINPELTQSSLFIRTVILDSLEIMKTIGLTRTNIALIANELGVPAAELFLSQVTIPDNTDLYLITYYTQSTQDTAAALTCQAEGYTNAECTKTFTGRGATAPQILCQNLSIRIPESPWIVDGSASTQNFQLDVTTSPAGKHGDLTYHWKAENSGAWTAGNQAEETTSSWLNTLKNFTADTIVRVWVEGQRVACEDYILAQSPDIPPGPGGGGGGRRRVTNPKIEKEAYIEDDYKNPRNLLNIGNKGNRNYNYVTYISTYTAGSTENSVEIWDQGFANGKITGDKNGTLAFKGMRINVEYGGTEYTIFKTDDYIDDEEDNPYEDNEDYENEYKCGTTSSGVCIENNFNEIENNFKTGEAIKFKNLNTGVNIRIKVQAANNTVITPGYCRRQLTPEQGCGEEFNNRISFKTNKNREDHDDAKVISICPYILLRQSGDVFFQSAIDTGIDVAYCSPVKSSTGPIVTPTPPPQPGIPRTGGTGSLPSEALFLTLPSHDVCRYSNLGNNLEGYNNVLENFSSTICELQADVAEQWTESHITAAINANITRIARWGANLNNDKLNNMSDLNNTNNKESGVFVKDGDLTINLRGTKLKAAGNIPAAQTYIVKNGNLYINSNIEYATTNYSNPNSIPSAAFIVLNGDIIIDNSVTRIDGILMAVNLNNNEKGKITNSKIFNENDTSTNLLTINGSLIGNVYELFLTRVGAGDPRRDEGSVTIRYDERILLNTPPGLGELINIQQSIVPN